jgi:hypothetical protein
VLEARHRLDFALESLERRGIAGSFRPNDFHRTRLLQQHVFGKIDLAHAAGAESLTQAVLAQSPCFERFLLQHVDAMAAVGGAGDAHAHPHRHPEPPFKKWIAMA